MNDEMLGDLVLCGTLKDSAALGNPWAGISRTRCVASRMPIDHLGIKEHRQVSIESFIGGSFFGTLHARCLGLWSGSGVTRPRTVSVWSIKEADPFVALF
jgi:hypothetical protein